MLDPLSRLTCHRLLISLLLLLLWAKALSPSAIWAEVALLSSACAAIIAVLAALGREPLFGPSLNRWDEAAALLGVHCLARLLM
jgi:hypothetical protein